MAPEKLYCKAVHPVVLAEYKAEIDKLPKRKQSKWSASAVDMHGTICKYRYVEPYFERHIHASIVKEVGRIVWPKDGWAPVNPLKTHLTFEQFPINGDKFLTLIVITSITRIPALAFRNMIKRF